MEEFEKKLLEFFDRHDESKRDLAFTIAHRYVNHQDEVFEHLSDIYHKKEGVNATEATILNMSFNTGGTPY